MIALKEITLDLKERYDRMLGEIPTSFYRFSNIFMARDCSHLKYAEIDDAFCLMSGIVVILCNMAAQIINERIDPRMREKEAAETSEVMML